MERLLNEGRNNSTTMRTELPSMELRGRKFVLEDAFQEEGIGDKSTTRPLRATLTRGSSDIVGKRGGENAFVGAMT